MPAPGAVGDHHPGPAVAQHVGHLRRGQVPVHRHHAGPGQACRSGGLEEGEGIAHDQRHGVPGVDTGLAKTAGRPGGTGAELLAGEGAGTEVEGGTHGPPDIGHVERRVSHPGRTLRDRWAPAASCSKA